MALSVSTDVHTYIHTLTKYMSETSHLPLLEPDEQAMEA